MPTSILTLNWSDATSEAHSLDARLSRIDAKVNALMVGMVATLVAEVWRAFLR